jgi:hypothetical protein
MIGEKKGSRKIFGKAEPLRTGWVVLSMDWTNKGKDSHKLPSQVPSSLLPTG